jgi:hypothetical protein
MITTLPVASALLLADAPPLPVTTWWSVITPVLAVLALTLGWLTIRRAAPRRRAA